jgi:hypothetical protein
LRQSRGWPAFAGHDNWAMTHAVSHSPRHGGPVAVTAMLIALSHA